MSKSKFKLEFNKSNCDPSRNRELRKLRHAVVLFYYLMSAYLFALQTAPFENFRTLPVCET